jgi:hypothetical protein
MLESRIYEVHNFCAYYVVGTPPEPPEACVERVHIVAATLGTINFETSDSPYRAAVSSLGTKRVLINDRSPAAHFNFSFVVTQSAQSIARLGQFQTLRCSLQCGPSTALEMPSGHSIWRNAEKCRPVIAVRLQ